MTKRTILLAVFFLGCGDRISLGEHDTDSDPLAVSDEQQGSAAQSAAPPPRDETPRPVVVNDPISWMDIDYIEVDESEAAVPRKMRVDSECRVTDHNGLDAMGDATQCQELLETAVDVTGDYGCGYSCEPSTSCKGTVRIHLKDGRDLVRDIAAERCSVRLPSVPTHKFVYGVWFSAGGG